MYLKEPIWHQNCYETDITDGATYNIISPRASMQLLFIVKLFVSIRSIQII